MNPFLDGPRTVLDLAGIRAFNDGVERARAAYEASGKGNACGTYAGYRRHVDRGEATCEPCREANRINTKRWATARKNRPTTSSQSPTSDAR